MCWLRSNRENRMRILQVPGGLDVGGTETWLLSLDQTLPFASEDVDYLVFDDREYRYSDTLKRRGRRVLVCRLGLDPVGFFWRVLRLLRDEKYDVVHAHTYLFAGVMMLAARLARVPVRVTHAHTHFEIRNRRFYALYTHAMREAIERNATNGFAVSEAAAGDLFGSDWQTDSRWRVLRCGIDLGRFGKVTRAEALGALGLPSSSRNYVHVARLVPEKNQLFLLDVFARILTDDPNARLLIAGDGPLRNVLEERARSIGISRAVSFLGIRNDIPLVLAASDCFLLPSLREGLPLSVIEGQVAGVPCIVSEAVTPSARLDTRTLEIVELQKGISCWSARAAIAAASPKVESSLLKRIASEKGFSVESAAQILINTYKETLDACYRRNTLLQ